eukprot:9628264-Alexandrium_andersonii.AAC.1
MQRQRCNAGPAAGYIQLPRLAMKADLDVTPWTSARGPARPTPEECYHGDPATRAADRSAAL